MNLTDLYPPEARTSVALPLFLPAPFVVGRDLDCDFVLSDETVSRKHCMIIGKDGTFLVRDLGSTAGTLVRGVPVGDTFTHLPVGEHLQLGSCVLSIRDEALLKPHEPPLSKEEFRAFEENAWEGLPAGHKISVE
jgi:predicted component of type VI protein secretion system